MQFNFFYVFAREIEKRVFVCFEFTISLFRVTFGKKEFFTARFQLN